MSYEFRGILNEVIVDCIKKFEIEGAFDAQIFIIDNGQVVKVCDVPSGHQKMAAFMVDTVASNLGASGYIFVTETWALNVPVDTPNFKEYILNPEKILDNPLKEERLAFYAGEKDEYINGYVEVARDDDGRILVGETYMEDINEEDNIANVADLLQPMIR